jgi:sulfur-oxidizing protein SoxY
VSIQPITRRTVVGAMALAPLAHVHAQGTDPNINRSQSDRTFHEVERELLAGRTPILNGIALDIPTLSENGNSVDVGIKVNSPWTSEDHVRIVHILSEQNPFPLVARFKLGYRSGRADVATRIRLATTQKVVVLAETTRGQVHRAEQEVIVILGACLDGG